MDLLVTLFQRDRRTPVWHQEHITIKPVSALVDWVEERSEETATWDHIGTKFEFLEDRVIIMLVSVDGFEHIYLVLEHNAADQVELHAIITGLAERFSLPIGELRTLRDEPWFIALNGQPA